jgi:hypothetical protein
MANLSNVLAIDDKALPSYILKYSPQCVVSGLRFDYGISNVFPYPEHNDDINTNFSLLCVYKLLLSQLKYLGTTGTNQHLIQEEIKRD